MVLVLTGSEFFGCNTEGTNISLIGGDCDDSNPQTNQIQMKFAMKSIMTVMVILTKILEFYIT